MNGKELHGLIYPDAPEEWWDNGADKLRYEQAAQHLTGCIAYQARAEIARKLRERANKAIGSAVPLAHLSSAQQVLQRANDDLHTADWIEEGCP